MTENRNERQRQVIAEFMEALSEVEDFDRMKCVLLIKSFSEGGRVYRFISQVLKLEEARRPKRIGKQVI